MLKASATGSCRVPSEWFVRELSELSSPRDFGGDQLMEQHSKGPAGPARMTSLLRKQGASDSMMACSITCSTDLGTHSLQIH
jgi:hypothetical protein